MENNCNLPAIPEDMSHKHARFVAEYFKNGRNGTQAAIAAGYSPKTAHVQASRMLRNVKVRAYLREVYRSYSTQIENVLEKLGGIGFSDLSDFGSWDEDGKFTLKPLDEIHPFHLAALKELDYENRIEHHGKGKDKYEVEIHRLRLKLHDKIRALSEIRRYIGGGADLPGEQASAGEGVEVVIIGGPFGFDRQEPPEQIDAETDDESL